MSEAQEPKDLRIAPGGAVIFEAVAGGPECKLVNTEKGLVISAYELVKGAKLEHRPVLTLTSAGVVIRGDLAVEGEI